MSDTCHRCGEAGEDRRTLRMSCFYAMGELGIPLQRQENGDFTMQVCKRCRADWLHAIKNWFTSAPTSVELEGTGVYIRDFGMTREATSAEIRAMTERNK